MITNTEIANLIDEYIRSERDRKILKDRLINGLDTQKVLAIIEEAMEAVSVLQPRLYDSIIRKLSDA